jgi:hypothetical protein
MISLYLIQTTISSFHKYLLINSMVILNSTIILVDLTIYFILFSFKTLANYNL